MKTNKTSKRALLTSVLSIALCLSMLIGTTFAWFTDTASTAVNKIQAGTLKVGLYKNEGCTETAEGQTLKFKTADNREEILWEPGCTYQLEDVYIKNEGNLALDYTVVITGIGGDVGLNKVIDWTFEVNGETLTANEAQLLPGATAMLTISGHMQETAGNEYQGKSIDNIAITVYATQSQYESDSEDNTYDAGADMTPDNLNQRVQGSAEVKANEATTVTTKDDTASAIIPAGTLEEGTTVVLSKTPVATSGNITVEAGQSAATYEISLTDSAGNKLTAADSFFTVDLTVGKLSIKKFLHDAQELTPVASKDAVGDGTYFYDKVTGVITFGTTHFSPFTVIYDLAGGNGTAEAPYLIATGEQAYQMRNYKGYFKLIDDVVVTNEVYLSGKTVFIDLNGHSITLEYADGVKPNNGGVFNVAGKKSNVTINDSSADQSGKVIGSDKTFTNKVTSAVRVGNYGKLTINGGHFYGMSKETSCIFVMTSTASSSKATVTINGGTFETATPSNGTYFVLNHQDSATAGCTITVNGGSFKNYNPGVDKVDPVNAKTGKIVLGTGCTTTSETVGNDTWYTVSKAK